MITSYPKQEKGLFTFYKEQEQQLILAKPKKQRSHSNSKKPNKCKSKVKISNAHARKSNKSAKLIPTIRFEQKAHILLQQQQEESSVANKFLEKVLEEGRRDQRNRGNSLEKLPTKIASQSSLKTNVMTPNRRVIDPYCFSPSPNWRTGQKMYTKVTQLSSVNKLLSQLESYKLKTEEQIYEQEWENDEKDEKQQTLYTMKRIYNKSKTKIMDPPQCPAVYKNRISGHSESHKTGDPRYIKRAQNPCVSYLIRNDCEELSRDKGPISYPREVKHLATKLPQINPKSNGVQLQQMKLHRIQPIEYSKSHKSLIVVPKQKAGDGKSFHFKSQMEQESPLNILNEPKMRKRKSKKSASQKNIDTIGSSISKKDEKRDLVKDYMKERSILIGSVNRMSQNSSFLAKIDVGNEGYEERSINWADRKKYLLKKLGIKL